MSTQTATALPANYVEIDGVTLYLKDQALHSLPGESKLTVKDRTHAVISETVLTGLDAEAIDAACREVPHDMHSDGRASVPGRARNLVKSAIEDGWIVRLTVLPQQVIVVFHQPARLVMEALRDLVATIDPNRSRLHYGEYMIKGYVSYDFDVDAKAMRVDAIHDYHLGVSREQTGSLGQTVLDDVTFRNVHVARVQSSHDEDKLTWREFVAQVHDQCPPLARQAIAAAAAQRDAKAHANAAFDIDAASPARENLRTQLRALRSQAERRLVALEGAAKPDLTPTGLAGFADRLRSAQCDRELHTAIVHIFDAEGTWDGNRRLHIDEVFVKALRTRLSTLTTAPLRTLATADELHILAYTADKLSALAKVTTTVEVAV